MAKHEDFRTFYAKGELYRGDIPVPTVVTGSYQTYKADGIEIQLSPDMDSLPQPGLFGTENKEVDLHATLPDGKQIWAPDLRVHTWGGIRGKDTNETQQYLWEGTADFFAEGDLEDFDGANGTLFYHLVTNPSPLADPGVNYWLNADGTSALFPEDGEKRPLRWQTPIGEAAFTDSFTYPTTEDIGYFHTQLRIRRFGVAIERRPENIVSPRVLLKELADMFQSAFSLVSLLSRRRVDWYRAELIYIPDNNLERDSRTIVAQRRRWLGYIRETSEQTYDVSLVRLNRLKDGLFEELLDQFEHSSLRTVLDDIIIHLMMSHEDIYFENRYVSAFTALESLVNVLANENQLYAILDEASLGNLMKSLKNTVKEVMPGQSNIEIRASLYSKLLELGRRAFTEKLLLLKDRYGLQLNDLWPEGSDIDFELDRMVKRRNSYLHQGVIGNFEAYFYDLNRIQNIVELWILKLLGLPRDAVNPAAIGNLVPIGQHNPE